MVPKQYGIGASVCGTLFHKNSKMQVLYSNLRLEYNFGKVGTATADFAIDIYLNSALYLLIYLVIYILRIF